MDKLQIALERARAEREQVLRAAANARAAADLAPGQLRPDVAAAPPPPPQAPFADDATFVGIRTVETHPGLMLGTGAMPTDTASPIGAAYKMLRTRVLQKMQENGWNTLAVVSPTPNDGKTFTAINLAIAIAGDTKHTTLLVDFDLRKPSIARRFGFEPEYGVEDCLTGRIGIAGALVAPSGYNKLVLLPAREPQQHSSELLTSERAARLVKEIKDRYSNRIVIFDLPPVLGADDALAFAPLVDCALMVVGAGHTRKDDLARSLEVLHKVPILGTVLNGSRSDNSAGYVY
jgi:Mrp family chromosome partitioning ATPase